MKIFEALKIDLSQQSATTTPFNFVPLLPLLVQTWRKSIPLCIARNGEGEGWGEIKRENLREEKGMMEMRGGESDARRRCIWRD